MVGQITDSADVLSGSAGDGPAAFRTPAASGRGALSLDGPAGAGVAALADAEGVRDPRLEAEGRVERDMLRTAGEAASNARSATWAARHT